MLSEDGHADVVSMKNKVEIAQKALAKMHDELSKLGDEDSLTTWWTNKVATAVSKLDDMSDYLDTQVEGYQIENFKNNKKYKSLYLTAKNWLKRDKNGNKENNKASNFDKERTFGISL